MSWVQRLSCAAGIWITIELHYACCVNTETKTHRYMRIYTSILQMMKEKYIDTHVTSLHYLFILIRFDRLQTSGLGFNVCLIEVQRHHHLRFRQNEVLHQWRLEIIADICWYTLPETNSFPLKTDTWKTTFLLERPIFRGVAGRITFWQLCNYQISFKSTAVKGCHDVIGI